MSDVPSRRSSWTFLTNHARVLTAVARNPATRVRDIASLCQLTERAVHAILSDLEEGGYLKHTRVGRRNTYEVSADTPLRHPADAGISLADLLALLGAFDPELTRAEADLDRDAGHDEHKDDHPEHTDDAEHTDAALDDAHASLDRR